MALKAHAGLVSAMQRFLDLRSDKDGSDSPRAGVLNKVEPDHGLHRQSAT